MKKPKILLTNDDGVLAPGILAAKRALDLIGDVTVIAPSRPRSGCGHSITLHKALRADEVQLANGDTAYSCNGMPSDCVILGVAEFVPDCDLVVAGINQGPNMGEDLTYSGTVGAAMEGAICGKPSIAISLDSFTSDDFSVAGEYLVEIAELVLKIGLEHDRFLNVNVPAVRKEEIKGIRYTEQGTRRYNERIEQRFDPRGGKYYWICGNVIINKDDEPMSDHTLTKQNYVSVTPISLKLTDYKLLEKLQNIKL